MKKKGYLAAFLAVFLGLFAAVSLCVQVLSSKEVWASTSSLKIVIDAGHGGIDGGVTGTVTGIKESDLNLKIALKLSLKLQEMGFDTAMTRKTEEGLYDTTAKGFKRRDMEKRREIIQNQSPDLLLSIHQNYYPSSAQRGSQVFYQKGDIEAEKLSLRLQDGLNALYAEEGVKGRKHTPAEYFVLHCAPCPAALIECGFLSSPKDEKLLRDEEFLSRLVEGICQGVTEYFFSKA